MTNSTILFNLKNLARFVEVTDKATGITESKRRIVKLRMSDFGDKATARLYKVRVLALADAINAFVEKPDDGSKGAEFKACAKALQGVYDFFKVNCGAEAFTVRSADVRYLIEVAAKHKFVAVDDGEDATLERIREGKSFEGIRGDVEEVMYFRVNGFDLPNFHKHASIAKVQSKVAEEVAKETAKSETPTKRKAEAEVKKEK